MEIEAQTEGSPLLAEVRRILDPLEESHSKFGLLSVRNDSTGEFLHSMVCFAKRLLRSKLVLLPGQIEEIVKVTKDTAIFRTRNRLLAEYYPFSSALQQLKKQSNENLADAEESSKFLHKKIEDLPYDDADSRRLRQAQVKLAAELLEKAGR